MSYESVLEELKAAGIVPEEKEKTSQDNNSGELELLLNMEKISGVTYSDEQKKILLNKDNSCIIACAGSGKALVNGTKVLTNHGYKNIEDLRAYKDVVYNENCEEELVLGVFPQGQKKVYEVTFNNGHTIECCGEHLWAIRQSVFREEDGKQIVSTYEKIVNTVEIQKLLAETGNEVQIPTANMCNGNYKISKAYDNCFTMTIDEVIEAIKEEKYLCDFTSKLEDIRHTMNIIAKAVDGNTSLSPNKIKVKNSKLAENIRLYFDLIGIHTVMSLEPMEDGYYIIEKLRQDYSSIISIEETNDYKEMTCIKVSGLTELFLTEHCYVTHNTTVLTNLIAKRIMTGEIKNSNKVVCTTYSKGGATEMEERLHALLNKFGMDRPIKVVTMHAFFYSIIRTVGLNLDVINEAERFRFIRESAKDANLELRDDDLANLSNLLSFQVNNLMSDGAVLRSEANTFDEMTLEQYSNVRRGYAIRKAKANMLDFDDMQMYLYKWLVKDKVSANEVERQASENLRAYCHGMWDDFYIDEAQDISKIQFAIIREMVQDSKDKNKLVKNLTFVGDDDQCLVEGTLVKTLTGYTPIEKLQIGDKVQTACGHGELGYHEVKHISKTKVDTEIVKVTTKSGKVIRATKEHVGFYIPKDYKTIEQYENSDFLFCLLGSSQTKNGVHSSYYRYRHNGLVCHQYGQLNKLEPAYNEDIKKMDTNKHKIVKKARLGYLDFYFMIHFEDLQVGDYVPLVKGKQIVPDKIKKIEIEQYNGFVFDLDIPKTRNFVANNIIVHNCIYKWRGADPSIILNIGNIFDMKLLMLSTNYRCKNKIVDFAAESVQHNSARYSKSMKAFNTGGNVKIAISEQTDLCNLSKIATNHIKKLIANGEKVEDICVMSRNNFHLAILSNMLLRNGIYTTSTHDMKLTNSSMYKDIKLILQLGEECYDTSVTRNLLWKVCKFLSIANASAIANFQDSVMLTTKDTLGYILKHIDRDRTIQFDKEVKHIPREAEEAMRYKWNKFSYDTIVSIKQLYKLMCVEDITKRICGICNMYLTSAGELLYKREDKNRSIKGLCNYVYLLLSEYGYKDTMEFLRITEQYEQGTMDVPGTKLTLTTIHSAKGKEWKNVIAFAVDNVTMPGKEDIKNMLKEQQSLHDINEYIDEERRLYYVEMTRAKENLLIITYKEPSIFIMESIKAIKCDTQDTNSMLIDSLSQDDYVSDQQYKNLFDFDVVNEKIISKNGIYHYDKE